MYINVFTVHVGDFKYYLDIYFTQTFSIGQAYSQHSMRKARPAGSSQGRRFSN